MQNTKNIIVAPLNWGLGHATRCIPIINALLKKGYNPILASDGAALQLLQKEFPNLMAVELPSYSIRYPKKGLFFSFYVLKSLPKLLAAVVKEQKIIRNIVKQQNVSGIISDNRFGVYYKKVPSVYITHQLRVYSGMFTGISSKIHQHIIKKFDECWVPDYEGKDGFSGQLGYSEKSNMNIKYLGVLSRFKRQETAKIYDYLVLLSGPEPQRGMLAKKMLQEFEKSNKKVAFVLGNVEAQPIKTQKGNSTIFNYLLSNQLSTLIQQSKVVVSRSGYTSILDFAKLGVQAFFIPTPGQFEQIYLAKRLDELQLVPFAFQEEFKFSDLEKVTNYKGLQIQRSVEFHSFLDIFQ